MFPNKLCINLVTHTQCSAKKKNQNWGQCPITFEKVGTFFVVVVSAVLQIILTTISMGTGPNET